MRRPGERTHTGRNQRAEHGRWTRGGKENRDPGWRHGRHADGEPPPQALRPGRDATITVVDKDDRHVYQPGLLFVPFGLAQTEQIVRPRHRQLHSGIAFHETEIDNVALDDDRVHLADGTTLAYDVLIVATGARLAARGDRGTHRPRLEGARLHLLHARGRAGARGGAALVRRRTARRQHRRHADQVPGGTDRVRVPRRLVPARARNPRQDGDRPRDAARRLLHEAHRLGAPRTYLLEEKEIELETEFTAGEVDGAGGRLVSYDGREVPFDLLVTVPLHAGADYVDRSPGLGDELDFVPTDPATLQSQARPNVFALGDATNVPTSKAGSVTHFEGEVLTRERSALPRRRAHWTSRTTATRTASSRPASTRRC